MKKKKVFLIIDANSLFHRAYHALPPLKTKKGELVNALYGFLLVFLKVLKEINPSYLAACFDYPAKTFRHQQFKEYKATRPPTPQDLVSQIPKIKEVLRVFNVPVFEKKGFEADDLIGTISKKLSKNSSLETVILSGDSDILQLIDKKTRVCFLTRGVKDVLLYGQKEVEQKYQGLKPCQIDDFKALKGDPSDNIPGVKGIGEKTALGLIKEFGTLEDVYLNLEKLKPKLRDLLSRQKKEALLSRSLLEIKKDVPIDFKLKDCQRKDYDLEKLKKVFEKYEFYSLMKKINKERDIQGQGLDESVQGKKSRQASLF